MITSLQHKKSFAFVVAIVLSILLGATAASGQTTSFTYQGRLTDGGTPANGNYDLQFALWDSLSGGAQVGSTQTLNTVAVSNGVFTVSLDFGANAFPGASRFLEISARPTGGSFTLLTPRQQITSTPYAVRSLNAASADSVPASGVPAGSGNYIQNTASPQASSNFNISGNGTAGGTLSGNLVNAATQYNLNGSRILSNAGASNLFAGVGAGAANTTGTFNAFFAQRAGEANKDGAFNSFFGGLAGLANTTGFSNSFFGLNAGRDNTIGSGNTFIGAGAGSSNTTGDNNTIIGGNADVIPGPIFNPTNATAIGYNARVSDSNAIVLGSINGVNGGPDTNVGIGTTAPKQRLHVKGQGLFTAAPFTFDPGDGAGAAIRIGYDSNGDYGYINANNTGVAGKNLVLQPNGSQGNVGIGTTQPAARLHVNDGGGHILFTRAGCIAPFAGIMFASSVTGACTNYALLGGDGNTYLNRPNGGSLTLREGNVEQFTIQSGGNAIFVKTVQLNTLGTAGGSALCRNAAFQVAFCSSSRRYKTGVEPFAGGLQLISRLQPVSFLWKANQQPDIGLIAEDVAQVEPLLTFKNQDGQIEGVNYSQVSVVLINAIKEQQTQIAQQQQQIEGLKKLVCRSHRRASVCK
jgi:hypothetical protein